MSTGSIGRTIQYAVKQSWSLPVASTSRSSSRLTSSSPLLPRCTCTHEQRRYSSHPPNRPSPTGQPPRKKRTIMDLETFKRKNIPITMLTAHDYPSARFIEQAGATQPSSTSNSNESISNPGTSNASQPSTHKRGVDICLVGDSLAMVACGYTSTTSLTLDEMLYHCRSVARGCHSSLLVADMPFGTYSTSKEEAMKNAIRIIQEGDMDAVKIEGGEEIADVVHHLTSRGVPVMAHIGLTPQRQSALSGYRVQGKTVNSALKVWKDAQIMQQAGAFSILIEAVPNVLAEWMSSRLQVPTIGIGAGNGCDGQVLVQLDMLGVSSLSKGPRFLKQYGDMERRATGAIEEYIKDVRAREFPNNEQHGYPIGDGEWQGFLEAVEGQKL